MESTGQLGVLLSAGATVDPVALRDIAQAAEGLGYASIWMAEHIAIPDGYASRFPYSSTGRPHFSNDVEYGESMSALAYLAGLTSDIRLGVSVIPMTTRDPVFLAKQAATVDVLSNGRLELGLGAGWLAEEADVLGRPRDHRTARLDEMIDILRKAWTLPCFSHTGRFWTIPDVWVNPKPVQRAELPIWIGGTGKRALAIAASKASGVLVLGGAEHVRTAAEHLQGLQPRKRIAGFMGLSQPEPVSIALGLRSSGADLVVANPHPEPRPTASSIRAAVQRLTQFLSEAMSMS